MERVENLKRLLGKSFNPKTIPQLLVGFENEDKVLDYLQKLVNPNIQANNDDLANFDYYLNDDNNKLLCELELKTRNITRNQYKDVPVSIQKLEKALINANNGIPSFFIYSFKSSTVKDKRTLYYYRFDENAKNIDWFIGKVINKFTSKDGKLKKCLSIYTDKLKPIRKLEFETLP